MKLLRRILLWVGIVFGLLVLGLVSVVALDDAIDAGRLEAVTNTTVPGVNGNPDVRAYVARPKGNGPFPTVIMIHEFFGLNADIVSKADLLAQQGYVVIAPDTFRGSSTSLIPRAIFQVLTTKPEAINADVDSVFAWAGAQPEVYPGRIAVLGFCYGGRASLAYSLHNNKIAATVVFYGSPETDPEILATLPGPVLGIFGGADQSIPLADVNAFEQGLKAAGIPHQISIYDGQPHAFVRGAEEINAGGAQGQAWAEMLAFLEAKMRESSSPTQAGEASAYLAPFDANYYLRLVFEHAFGHATHIDKEDSI
jgi:carboxymethylenebutenolidase